DDVEIDQPQSSYTRRSQIQAQRRTQAARADQKHARGFQLALAFQSDFGQDQVAVVSGQFVFVQLRQFGESSFERLFDGLFGAGGRAARYRRDDADLVLLPDLCLVLLQIADVLAVDEDVDEAAQLAACVEEVFLQIRELRGQFVERFAYRRRFDWR